jgi:glutathione S-transferase
MKLYGFFRPPAAFRVRIALNLQRLDYESAFIHLRRGDQSRSLTISASTRKGWLRRGGRSSPATTGGFGATCTGSWDRTRPQSRPGTTTGSIAGFRAIEPPLAGDTRTGAFCHGDAPSPGDVALTPQVVNSERYRLDLAPFPTIRRNDESCMALEAFAAAYPDAQPDREQ